MLGSSQSPENGLFIMEYTLGNSVQYSFFLLLLGSILLNLFLAWRLMQAKNSLTTTSITHEKEKSLLEQELLNLQKMEKEKESNYELLYQKISAQQQEQFLKLATSSLESNIKLWQEQQKTLSLNQESKIQSLLTPVKDRLKEMDEQNRSLTERWMKTHSALSESLSHHNSSMDTLREQTQKLTRTLYSSQDRGAWGEMQLKRIVEIAGLEKYCDYSMQVHLKSAQGEALRPDAMIHLPQGRHLLIDAKAPLQYDPNDSKVEENAKLHVQALKKHIQTLASKEYASLLDSSPDFVLLFVPTESILHRALKADPSLFEQAASKGIILTSPASLISILKCIHLTWRQATLEENVEKAMGLCQTLLSRLTKLSTLFAEMGKSIQKTSQNFEQAMASYEKRVLPTARKLGELTSIDPTTQKALEAEVPVRNL